MIQIKHYVVTDRDGDEGYVTACCQSCADSVVENSDLSLTGASIDTDDPVDFCQWCGKSVLDVEDENG